MQIFTVTYGEKHIELFRRACLKSLAFPDNRRAVYSDNSCWNIATESKYEEHLSRIIDAYFPELEVNFIPMSTLRDYIDPIQSAIIKVINKCLKTNQRCLMAPPDTIFGNKTVPHLMERGVKEDSVVVVPHPRVLPAFLSEDMQPYLSNAELVTRAWKYLHQSWSDAEVGHPRQNSFVGGVTWTKLAENTYSVIHRLPTPYYMKFTEEDLNYFKNQISFGGFDHTWPSDILIPRNRYNYCTNSDECMIVEITEREKNVPPIWPGSVDNFWRPGVQEEHNKHIKSTFRGE